MFLGISFLPQLLIVLLIVTIIFFGFKKKIQILFRVILTIVGVALGLPLSYYFQPQMIQAKVGGIEGYIKNFGAILEAKDLLGNVIIGVVVFAIIGFSIGYLIDRSVTKKNI